MRAQFVIPVLVSILILGSFGLSQQVFAAHLGCSTNTDCDDGNACTVDNCLTLFGICTHAPGNAGDVCRTSTDACDAPETCDGVRGFCPVDAKSPADTACGNPGDGICDLQDTCDGAGNCVDEVAQVTVSCREADNDCDAEELCDGAGSCPADVFEPAGNVCGIPTFGVDQNCDGAGICVPSSAITCGEGTTFNEDTSECEANICEPKVDVCHKNKTTINISLNALPAHLNHGDTVGACEAP